MEETISDFAVKHEGEKTLLELLQYISTHRNDYENIDDLIWRNNNNEIIENKDRKLLTSEELCELPFPDYEAFELNKYICYKTKILPIITSLLYILEKMWKKIKKNSAVYIAFIIILLLSLRKLFFLKSNFILGHHWDFIFPDVNFLFDKLTLISKYTWWNFNLGTPLNLRISLLIPSAYMAFLSQLFGVKIAILSLLILVIAVSFFSFKKFVDFIIKKNTINYIPAFLYAFSPLLFNTIIGGAWTGWVSYCFAPLLFLNLLGYINNKSPKYLVGFLLSAIFVLSFLQYFVLIETIIILFLIYSVIVKKQIFKKVFIRYSYVHAIFIFLNLYWILPFLSSFTQFYRSTISNTSLIRGFISVKFSHQSILHILMLYGFSNRDMYYYALPHFIVPIFIVSVLFIWMLIVLPIILKKSLSEYRAILWLFILFALIFLIKGGNRPLGNFTMWFYNIFPLMKMYRNPQHMMFVAAFVIPILIAYSLSYLYNNFKYKRTIVVIFSFCILIWISGWWYNGDLGHAILKNKHRDYVDFYTLSPGIKKIYKKDEKSSLFHRVLFLPAVHSPTYLKTQYQNGDQGGIPEYVYLKNPTFTAEGNPFANKIDVLFGKNIESNHSYINYLSLFSVRDIVLRKDIYPHFTGAAKYWNSNKVRGFLNSFSEINKFVGGEYTTGYRIKSKYFLPFIYSPTDLIFVSSSYNSYNYHLIESNINYIADLSWRIVMLPNYELRSGIFFTMLNTKKKNFALNAIRKSLKLEEKRIIVNGKIHKIESTRIDSELTTVEFKAINPTKYIVIVHNVKANFPLILNQNYSYYWNMYPEKYPSFSLPNKNLTDYQCKSILYDDCMSIKRLKYNIKKENISYTGDKFISKDFNGTIQNDNIPSGHILQTLFQTPYPHKYHFIANGYANSWWINIHDIKKLGRQYYKVNKNGTYDFEFVIDFWPQRFFYIGLLMSGTTIIVLILFLIFDYNRKRHDEKR